MNLEQLMIEAADGSKESAAAFYSSLLEEKIFVVDRFQSAPLSDPPKYPDEFFNILGIQTPKRVYVPVFSKAEHITTWASTSLTHREIKGADLLKQIPEDWWLIFNPGQEIEKELSAWELNHLRAGKESISEIINEIFHEDELEIELEALKGSDYPQLKFKLISEGKSSSNISKIILAKQPNPNHSLLTSYNILVGIYVNAEDANLKTKLQQIADNAQIGNDPAKVFILTSKNKANYNFFENYEPVYNRESSRGSSFFDKISKFFS